MILGIYIFINRGRTFIFRKELERFDEDSLELINKTIINIVNQFESYDVGVYRTEVGQIKVLFAVYGEVLSIVLLKEEKLPDDEELSPELINASDSLFASIIFNQPLLIKLIEKEAGIENFKFYTHELPEEKRQVIKKSDFISISTNEFKRIKYFNKLDSIIGEVNTKLISELKEKELQTKKDELPIQKVFSNFMELTFRYVRMYIMEGFIRDLIEDHSDRSITDIKMGINDILFYFRKSIYVLKDRPEIKYFLKIMDGQRFGIQIKNRTSFTILFLEEAIEITNGIDNKYPLISFNSTDIVVDLILGKIDVLKIALSKEVKATKLDKIVEWTAPLAAVLIRIYERKELDNITTIKRLTLEGLAYLIEALFVVNLQSNLKKLQIIKGIHKIISLQIIGKGVLTLIIDGSKLNIREIIRVKIGPTHLDPDIIIQGSLEHICLYANGEINFITALQKIKLIKGISMNPIDLIKGKTFKQISDLFSLWRLSQI
ncbi:MAG: hypothetical protein ACTSPY_16650 [Candidatus Helarchaeota archaeon]